MKLELVKFWVLFIGPIAVGKGTQAALAKKAFNFVHVSTGEILRAFTHKDNVVPKGQQQLQQELRSYVDSGKLVPDHLMIKFLFDYLENLQFEGVVEGVILDGFPRTDGQAEALAEKLKSFGAAVDLCVQFMSDKEACLVRSEKRAKEENRTDAEKDVERIERYFSTSPERYVAYFYKALGVFVQIDAKGSVLDVFVQLTTAVVGSLVAKAKKGSKDPEFLLEVAKKATVLAKTDPETARGYLMKNV